MHFEGRRVVGIEFRGRSPTFIIIQEFAVDRKTWVSGGV